jgi:hypothetical protein
MIAVIQFGQVSNAIDVAPKSWTFRPRFLTCWLSGKANAAVGRGFDRAQITLVVADPV